MVVAIHQPQYLPWLPYFDKADACDVFVYLDNVQFQKNGVQNRNQIKTAQGAAWLTVPVRASLELTIRETPIADQRWAKKHLRTIEQSYAQAAYGSRLTEGLSVLLERPWSGLAELNIAVTGWMLDQLGIVTRSVCASELEVSGTKDDLILGLCKALGATAFLSGQGAKSYLDEAKFARQGVELVYQEYQNQPYDQCFAAQGFVPDLSALDLILNHGPRAREVMLAGRAAQRTIREV